MGLLLVSFTFLGMAIFGIVALIARVVRPRPPQLNERRDLEENSLIDEEWELVRQQKCLPTACPRTIGVRPRPRRDTTCEICAALHLERHWQRLLDVSSPESPVSTRSADRYELPMRDPPLTGARRSRAPVAEHAVGVRRSRALSHEPVWGRSCRAFFVAGFLLVVSGSSLFAFSSELLPGYLLVAIGIACLVRAGARRAR
jgi:hypothetical protein